MAVSRSRPSRIDPARRPLPAGVARTCTRAVDALRRPSIDRPKRTTSIKSKPRGSSGRPPMKPMAAPNQPWRSHRSVRRSSGGRSRAESNKAPANTTSHMVGNPNCSIAEASPATIAAKGLAGNRRGVAARSGRETAYSATAAAQAMAGSAHWRTGRRSGLDNRRLLSRMRMATSHVSYAARQSYKSLRRGRKRSLARCWLHRSFAGGKERQPYRRGVRRGRRCRNSPVLQSSRG